MMVDVARVLRWRLVALAVGIGMAAAGAFAEETARGTVFHDENGNGVLDDGEPGLEGVLVSNGRDVTATHGDGRYELPVWDDCIVFVIKPRDWAVPVDENKLPRFHYIHNPGGSPELEYPGVEPTGPLPAAIDFPLTRHEDPETYTAIAFADPQPYNLGQIEYLAFDVVSELVGTDAVFGMTLGDIVGDQLNLFEPMNEVVGQIGIPWWNIAGNHDLNFDGEGFWDVSKTFQRVYGPPWYAFEYGPVSFIALHSTDWHGDGYTGGVNEDQLAFMRNYLAHVPEDNLVVLLMHIPLIHDDDQVPGHAIENPADVLAVLENHPNSMSLSGHWHNQTHYFVEQGEHGWMHEEPHHHFVVGTASGSWWRGHHDEYGIPHATMDDGTPNGYLILTFEGNAYRFVWKPARRPIEWQMNIYAPDTVARADIAETEIVANAWSDSARCTVEMRLNGEGPWVAMERYIGPDPNFQRLQTLNAFIPEQLGGEVIDFYDYSHWENLYSLWRAPMPDLEPGGHRITVRFTDLFGQVFENHRVIRVE
ncbi:MAG: calcineurin-like phosphoesterase family protein [Candidatus Hydrogenedentota bacterium]